MKIRQANKNDLKEIVKIEKICFPKAEAASEKDIYERCHYGIYSNKQ